MGRHFGVKRASVLIRKSMERASLLLYGVHAAAGSALAATGAALADVAAMARISGGRHVPDFIGETGSAGWPPAVLEQLERVHARVERSVWRVAGRG